MKTMKLMPSSRSAGLSLGLLVAAGLLSCCKVTASTSSAMDSNSMSTSCDTISTAHLVGNGLCDHEYNSAECGYDGGDCCSCTCTPGAYGNCGDGFACIDPEAPCVDDDDVTEAHASNCYVQYFSDGECDQDNNNELCGYDGGDCCSCTCASADFECGEYGYACIDPEAPCVDDDDVTEAHASNCYVLFLSDGECDQGNNNELCGYDGGDCCSCTCASADFECGVSGYACIDPEAPCVDDNDVTEAHASNCYAPYFSDGECDQDNNNELCGYDGGDCCSCTCASADFECGESGYACIDPEAPCVDPAKADQHSAAQSLTKFSTATFVATFAAGLGAMHLFNLVS